MATSKPKIIKNYEKLDEKLRSAISEAYPNGFSSELQTFDIGNGKFMTALPFETEQFYYLIKIPVPEEIDEKLEDYVIEPIDEEPEDISDELSDDDIEEPMDDLEALEVVDESADI